MLGNSSLDRKLFKRREEAISPIIATLLLILIAIASGVILYAYVSGFIANSTQNTGTVESTISLENPCVSAAGSACTGTGYSVSIRNLGANTISYSGTVNIQIYFTDMASSNTVTLPCPISVSIAPGSSFTCKGTVAGLSAVAGDTVTIKVVMPDGGAASLPTKTIS